MKNFEDVLKQYKDETIEALVALGESKRIPKILNDIDNKISDFKYFFDAGKEANKEDKND